MQKPELLAPGGTLEKCKIALLYGADAVYVGGTDFSLRSYARNLDDHDLAEAVFFAHRLQKKLYVTVNVFARETDLQLLPGYLEYLQQIGVDAVIVSDPAVLLLVGKYAPSLSIHLSTQANTTNSLAIEFWRQQGIRRINLARELSIGEVAAVCSGANVELEMFVHGAMCVSYSGRCLMSAFLTGRSANSGLCTQPCRWSYELVEETRPGERFTLTQDDRGGYLLNSKDLCLIEEIGRLSALGLTAFKIEGRMKGALYLATVIRSYRLAIDRWCARPHTFRIDSSWIRDLDRVSHRPYTTGLLFPDREDASTSVSDTVSYVRSHCLAGLVRRHPGSHPEYPCEAAASTSRKICLEVRTRTELKTEMEFLYPDGTSRFHVVDEMKGLRGEPLAVAHPNTLVEMEVPFPTFPLQVARRRHPDAPLPTAEPREDRTGAHDNDQSTGAAT
jgi:putative protease